MIRGWNFFAILSSCYAPSSDLYYAILNWLSVEINNNSEKEIVQHANYIFKRLYKSFEQKRKQIPSDNEVIHIEVRTCLFNTFNISKIYLYSI